MHTEFRKLLDDVTGVSEFVLAVNIDIRGLSSFSMRVESPETAIYLKRVYTRIIEDYFPNASFFKPTGDGLLIIVPYSERDLQYVLPDSVGKCIEIVKHFDSFCSGDPMINFEVPGCIGIGLSRGAACRITSNDRTVYYSGRSLNMASRLMDFARPRGVVFDGSFGIELLPGSFKELFGQDHVYIRGLAEDTPESIWFTTEWTTISPLSKQPIQAKWEQLDKDWTLRRIKESGSPFIYELEEEPTDPDNIQVTVTHPWVYNGRKIKDMVDQRPVDFKYLSAGGIPKVELNFRTLARYLERAKVRLTWPVVISIRYRRK